MIIRLALAQINMTVGDLEGNRARIIRSADAAKKSGADIVAFPELAISGYPPEDLLFKDHFVTDNLKALKLIARAAKGIVIIIGFVDRDKQGLYNAAAVLSDGKCVGIYHKNHLPNYSVFDEKRYFLAGTAAPVFKCCGVPVGINVCEDIWIAKGPAYRQAKAGAKFIINISSSPYEAGKRAERLKVLRARAKEVGIPVAYVNLVGGQDELVFDGASMVVDPAGKVLAAGTQFTEDLVIVDVDVPGKELLVPARLRLDKRPLKGLDPMAEIYRALVLGARDYIQKNGFKKVVIGLSGGIDSALVAAIACDAVGRENVVGISMPTRFNVEATRSDARRLAENLGMAFHEIPIEDVFMANLKTLVPYFKGEAFGLAEENLQARIRGNILMAFSNKFGWLVLTTGNKSEMATGYCTLYGDMSGGYAVIKDILKMEVYDLCAHVNAKAGQELIPRSIFTRPPSAELRADQKDQDSLPPYPVLDALLVEYVERHGSLKDMLKKHKDAAMARRVMGLVDKSEYKRRQAPPGVKISRCAFGKDWRLPLTNHYKAE